MNQVVRSEPDTCDLLCLELPKAERVRSVLPEHGRIFVAPVASAQEPLGR